MAGLGSRAAPESCCAACFTPLKEGFHGKMPILVVSVTL